MEPATKNNPSSSEHTENVANGPILILLAVLLLAILGGMYRWFVLLDNDIPTIPASLRPTPEMNNEPESTSSEARTEAMGVVSTSDEIPALEADIDSTDLDSLESELNAIEAELEAALEPTESAPEPSPTDVAPVTQ